MRLSGLLIHPVAQTALLAGGLAACLWMFFLLKREIAAAARHFAERQQELDATVSSLLTANDETSRRLQDAELRAADPAAIPGGAVNFSKRSQALRMHRRGDPPEQIAAVLGIPASEVRLLLKTQEMILERI